MVSKVGFSYPKFDFTTSLDRLALSVSNIKSDELLCRLNFRVSPKDHYASGLSFTGFKLKPWKGDEPTFLRLRNMLPAEVAPDDTYLQRWIGENPKPTIQAPVPSARSILSTLGRLFGTNEAARAEPGQNRGNRLALASWESAYRFAEHEALLRKNPLKPPIPVIPSDLQAELEGTRTVKSFGLRLAAEPMIVRRERPSTRNFVFYNSNVWSSAHYLKADDWKLLIERAEHQFRSKLDSIKNAASTTAFGRIAIPEEVRLQVWRRDQGKCARCGSRENLEFDHIVPVAMGGSSTTRNIELLCQNCNRSKGCSVA